MLLQWLLAQASTSCLESTTLFAVLHSLHCASKTQMDKQAAKYVQEVEQNLVHNLTWEYNGDCQQDHYMAAGWRQLVQQLEHLVVGAFRYDLFLGSLCMAMAALALLPVTLGYPFKTYRLLAVLLVGC